jgi:hypothetical protein
MKMVATEKANDVNEAAQERLSSVAFGRRGNKASSVVNERNPCTANSEKKMLRVGTWNVRTLQRTGKLVNVIREMRTAKINILGLSEVRWKDGGDFISDGVRVIYAGGTENQRGVAVLLDEDTAKCVISTEAHGDRILVVKLKGWPTDIVLLQIYMPTTSHDDEEVEVMYDSIDEIIKKVKGTDYLIIMGDWNAVVGEGKEGKCVGDYGLGKKNDRGERLIEFCKQQQMMVTNTWFKQEKRRRYTWKAPGDLTRYQLDYILVRERYRNSVKNSHAYPGADADTDHNLVAMSVFLTLKNLKRKKNKKRWNRDKLKSCGVEFTEAVESRIKYELQGTVDQKWQTLKTMVVTQAKAVIGYSKGQQAKKPWVTEEMLKKMDERRKWKHQSTEIAKKEYKRLNNELRRATDKARESWWDEQCSELEELQRQGKYDKLYSKISKLQKKNGKSSNVIKDRNGILLTNEDEVRNRWKEYIEELYDKENKPTEEEMIGTFANPGGEDDLGPTLLREEIEKAIEELKDGKSEGVDEIPAEMIKCLGEKAKEELVKLCQEIYTTGEWPSDFVEMIMIPLQKKPNATECSDHRTISLIVHASKILLKILTKRLEGKVEAIQFIGDDQFGFRKGRGTREAIAVLRTLGERSLQHGKDIFVCFVDYEKAFDRVNWSKLMKILERIGVDEKDRQLIRHLYLSQSVVVRVNGGNSEPGLLGRGVRQGCPLSPLLFNIYIQQMIMETMENVEDGVKVGGQLVNAIRFADDQAMVASTNAGLQRIMDSLNRTSGEYGMRINIKKTKMMRISREEGKSMNITINGNKLEQVTQFCYLGSTITEDCRSHTEIKKRIAMGKEAFDKRRELLRGKLKLELKKRMVKSLVWSVVLYGAETWTLTKEDTKRLEAFEMWTWRRILKISWTEHQSNEEVLRKVQEERTLMNTIRKRQTNWIGHILRGDSLLKTVMEGRMLGKKVAGRPRIMMLDWMEDRQRNQRYKEIKEKAQNRSEWHHWIPGPAI